MKIRYIAALLILVFLAACSDVAPYGEELADSYFLKVGENSVTLDGQSERSIQVDASKDLGWYVGDYPRWLRIEDSYGAGSRRLTISCNEENPTTTNREGNVVLYSDRYDKQAQFQVVQAGTYLTTDSANIYFPTAGGDSNFSLNTNARWHIKSKPSWLTVSPESGNAGSKQTISITAKTNAQDEERSGELVIETTNKATSQTVRLTQAPVLLQVDKEQIPMAPEGGSSSFTITANAAWSVSCSSNWCTVTPIWGSGSAEVTVEVTKHTGNYERTAKVTVTSGNVERTIRVVQTEASLELKKQTATFLPAGGEETINISSNTEWTAASDQTWCTVTPQKHTGDGSVTITAAENTGNSQRTAEVTIKAGGLTKKVNVTQEGVRLSTNKESYAFSPDGGNEQFTVSSNAAWTATSDKTWCTVTPQKSTGDGSITITTTEYTGENQRIAEVTIKAGELTRKVYITQEGIKLSTNKDSHTFGPDGGNEQFTVSSNAAWTVASDSPEWCSVSPSAGKANGAITISTSEYTGTTSRKARITIKAGQVERFVSIVQDAPTLRLNPQTEMSFSALAGSKPLSVYSNSAWTASSNAEWCTLSQTSGSKDGSLNVNVKENVKTSERKAVITVTVSNQTQRLTVIQSGAAPIFEVDKSSMTFNAEGQQLTLTITSNTNWTITNVPSWINVDKVSGSDNATVLISASANPTNKQREGSFLTKCGEKTIIVNVSQNPAIVKPGDDDNPLPRYSRNNK